MPAKSVFISHATRDDAQVKELRHNLELLDVLVWTDSENLNAGAALTKEIERNIENADAFVALLTLDGLKSSWVRKEIRHAQKSGKPIIPLLSRDVEPVLLEGLFPDEPIAIKLTDGTDAIQSALPQLRAARPGWFTIPPTEAALSRVADHFFVVIVLVGQEHPKAELSEDAKRFMNSGFGI